MPRRLRRQEVHVSLWIGVSAMNFRDSPLRRKAPSIDYRDKRPKRALLLAVPVAAGLIFGLVVGRVSMKPAPVAPSLTLEDAAPAVAAPDGALPAAAETEEEPAVAASTAIAPSMPVRPKLHPVTGEYANGAVKNVILRNAAEIRTCYESYLEASPSVDEGKVTIDWQIDADGKVVKPAVVTSELDGETLADCLVARFAGFEFPPPPDRRKTYAVHTFVFRREL